MKPVIDAHIHLDWYEENNRNHILEDLSSSKIEEVISVSYDVESCHKNLSYHHPRVQTALGYHPEQELPSKKETEEITNLIYEHQSTIVAIGEVGLPYYTQHAPMKEYVQLLDHFIALAKEIEKPVNLHAIYEGAEITCDLLEKHNVTHAHFHWFKGSQETLHRMKNNGYMISITPDCLYEEEIQTIIRTYPLKQIMVETDGPWPFEGPFKGQLTHPDMIHDSIAMIAKLKKKPLDYVYKQIYENTRRFYQLEESL